MCPCPGDAPRAARIGLTAVGQADLRGELLEGAVVSPRPGIVASPEGLGWRPGRECRGGCRGSAGAIKVECWDYCWNIGALEYFCTSAMICALGSVDREALLPGVQRRLALGVVQGQALLVVGDVRRADLVEGGIVVCIQLQRGLVLGEGVGEVLFAGIGVAQALAVQRVSSIFTSSASTECASLYLLLREQVFAQVKLRRLALAARSSDLRYASSAAG